MHLDVEDTRAPVLWPQGRSSTACHRFSSDSSTESDLLGLFLTFSLHLGVTQTILFPTSRQEDQLFLSGSKSRASRGAMPVEAEVLNQGNGPAASAEWREHHPASSSSHSCPCPAPTLAQNLAGLGELPKLRLPLSPPFTEETGPGPGSVLSTHQAGHRALVHRPPFRHKC